VPLESAAGANVTTIEGLSQDSSHPLQQLWIEMNVPQCGYCQSGMLMAAAALLKNIPNPTDRISTLTSITSAGAAPILACVRRSTKPPPDRRSEAEMGTMTTISRRQFIVSSAAFGGGMALGVVSADSADAAFLGPVPWGETDALPGAEFTPWISIGADDIVTVRVATPEIGNGAMTQTPMLVAEELACDWNKIRVEFAPTSRDYREDSVYSKNDPTIDYSSGRSTNPERMKLMLQVGASARERLKAAAAGEWKVPVAEISVKDSVLTHGPSGRTLRYGDIAAKAATIKLPVEPTPKPQSEWVLLGKASPAKLNVPQIVNGSAIYGMDVRLPGMVYAALRQSPVHGGKMKSFDAEKARAMPGVLAVVTVDPDEPRGLKIASGAPSGYDQTHVRAAVAVIAGITGRPARRSTRCRSNGTTAPAPSGSRPTRWSTLASPRWSGRRTRSRRRPATPS